MSHYAKILNDKVVEVLRAEPEFFTTFKDTSPGRWIQTSYNTYGNQHKLGGTPMRGNYACIGYTYDYEHDVFYEPQPFPSWTLNHATWLWEAPTPYPADQTKKYVWDEATTSWVEYGS